MEAAGIELAFHHERLMTSAHFDSLMTYGPKIWETIGRQTMIFLPDVNLNEEERSQKNNLT